MELSGFTTGASAATPESYLWEVPGKPASIQLDFDVIDRLEAEVMRAFTGSDGQGLEVGGILLGTAEAGGKLVARIEDFEPVVSSHSEGPAYVIATAEDRKRFEEVLARWQSRPGSRLHPIGFYRSHTREGLGLTPQDLDLFSKYFPDKTAIALLVKPFATRAPTAGLFFREEEVIRGESSYKEIPFRRRDLGGGEKPAVAPPPPAGTAAQAPMSSSPPKGLPELSAAAPPPRETESGKRSVVPQRSLRLRGGWVWVPLSFIFLLLGTILGFQVALSVRSQINRMPSQDPYALHLSAVPSAGSVHLRWDRNSPAIRKAQRGVLVISENGKQKSVDLDAGHLQNGSVIYRRVSDDVKFRLEVFTDDNVSVGETVEFQTTGAK